jgi:hypothetical protein
MIEGVRMIYSRQSDEALKAAFIDAAIIKLTAPPGAKGNKQSNAANAKIGKIYLDLKARPDGLNVFLDLLHHPDERVRISAGPFGISHFPEQYEPMIEELSKEGSASIALRADMLLEHWRDGIKFV